MMCRHQGVFPLKLARSSSGHLYLCLKKEVYNSYESPLGSIYNKTILLSRPVFFRLQLVMIRTQEDAFENSQFCVVVVVDARMLKFCGKLLCHSTGIVQCPVSIHLFSHPSFGRILSSVMKDIM